MGGGTSPQSQQAAQLTESDFSGLVVFGDRRGAFKCPPHALAEPAAL
jgi:hypothetical protein